MCLLVTVVMFLRSFFSLVEKTSIVVFPAIEIITCIIGSSICLCTGCAFGPLFVGSQSAFFAVLSRERVVANRASWATFDMQFVFLYSGASWVDVGAVLNLVVS